MYNSRIKNMEIPENLFSNLGEIKAKKQEVKIEEPESPHNLKKIKEDNDTKLTSYSKQSEYRNRITKMYEDIKNIKPIDNEIDNILYFNNYVERGIVVKPKVSSLKQFWTEYRLISNEKNILQVPVEQQKEGIDDFDKLFAELSLRVTEINKYIDELKEMKNSMNKTSTQLKEDKENLKVEKQEFQNYKRQEETKIQEEKENLKINFERLQTIIDDLDKKLGSIDKVEI